MIDSVRGYRVNSSDDTPAKPHPTDYLKQLPKSARLLHELQGRAATEGSNCLNQPDAWLEYEPEDPPSPKDARALCAGCPLLELCDEYATIARPAHGIWGGRVRGTL